MLSIIIPCYNEEVIIEDFIDELRENINKIKEDFEIILLITKVLIKLYLRLNKILINSRNVK